MCSAGLGDSSPRACRGRCAPPHRDRNAAPARVGVAHLREHTQRCSPGVATQCEHHVDRTQQAQLAHQERQAAIALLGRRLVRRRRAAIDGGDVRISQHEAVGRPDRPWPWRVAGVVERFEEQFARPAGIVTGEDPAGAVGPVCGRRQPDQQQTCRGIPKAGHRSAPIDRLAVTRHAGACHFLTPFHESRTASARGDVCRQIAQAIAAHVCAGSSTASAARPKTR